MRGHDSAAGAFTGAAAFSGAAAEPRFVQVATGANARTIDEGDVDGGGADFHIALTKLIALTDGDFLL